MASSSTSSIHKSIFKYDVFLSFRGEDTRNTFVGHLYDALKRESIETYKDDKNLEKGGKISKELIQAIEESRFHVIVFSKNYASSSWCLDELVKIMECQKTHIGQTVYPIFYDVEPTEIRKQSGEFGKAFAKHEKAKAAQKWRDALVEATSFSGWDLRTTADGQEVEFIKLVVKDISSKSKLPPLSADENLVGMRTRIDGVVSLLNTFPEKFCMIGIWGMRGSGKTTLAKAVFDQIHNEFEGSSFVENVRECSNLKSLQQQVLIDVLNRQNIIVNGVLDGETKMKKYMLGRKVLVVLDDVDNIHQLKALVGEPNWFMEGSRIIITSRDKQVLVEHRVNSIHDVRLLTYKEAIWLLSRYAFRTEIPIPGYEELSTKVVGYAGGLPLIIKTVGSSISLWIDNLKKLEKNPFDRTLQKSELRYIHLEEDQKEIFLDAACILKGWKKDEAIRVLESYGFNGFSVFKGKSLITISHDKNLSVHDDIEEMGKHLVRRLQPNDPAKHSQLWIKKKTNTFSFVETQLITLDLNGCEDLLELHMPREYPQLKTLNLEGCRALKKLDMPGECPQLITLNLSGCEDLSGLHIPHKCPKLKTLNLKGCRALRKLDMPGECPQLITLDINGCEDLLGLKMPYECLQLKTVNLEGCEALKKLDMPGECPQLITLDLNGCEDLLGLHMPRKCLQLERLNLEGCTALKNLDMPGECPRLITLNLNGCEDLLRLHMPRECPQLKTVNLKGCRALVKLDMPWECPQLITLDINGCEDLLELHMPRECTQLETFDSLRM